MSAAVWTLDDSEALDAALVAHDGHRMRLRGRARLLALKSMARMGLSGAVMAERLRSDADAVNRVARRNGIHIPREDVRRWAEVTPLDLPTWTAYQRGRGRAAA